MTRDLHQLYMAMEDTVNQSEAITSSVVDGVKVAIIGKPNAGKSSLVNRLAGREVAITSPTPGTTRDLIDVACSIDGIKHKLVITDTAGIRFGGSDEIDLVEMEGMKRARRASHEADINILVADVNDVITTTYDDQPATSVSTATALRLKLLKIWEEMSPREEVQSKSRKRARMTILNKLRFFPYSFFLRNNGNVFYYFFLSFIGAILFVINSIVKSYENVSIFC